MKVVKNNYYDVLKYKHLLRIFYKIKKNFRNKKAIFKYELNLYTNLYSIIEKLYANNYIFSNYRIFLIRKPKYRIIMCENINDKIVNHLVSEYILLPLIESKLIDTNVATRRGKGSGYAFNTLKKYIIKLKKERKDIFVLKIDIKKYFYNIDHELLMSKIKRYIKDKSSINLIQNIINLTNDLYVNDKIKSIKEKEIEHIKNLNISTKEKKRKIEIIKDLPIYKKNKGLPIGNMTSQILAVFYMNDVDHFIKEELKLKYYIRYMDDLIILDNDLNRLKEDFVEIEKRINKLKLEVNSKSNIYSLKNGISFLGYTFKINKNNCLIIRYNNQTIRKINKYLKSLYKNDIEKYERSVASYKGYISKANTKYKKNMLNKYEIY